MGDKMEWILLNVLCQLEHPRGLRGDIYRSSSHLEAPLEVFATLHQIFDIVNLGTSHDADLKL